jgi:hypothetical protein
MQDKAKQGFGYLLISLIPAYAAMTSQDPLIKFAGSLLTVNCITKASECFQNTGKNAYNQLTQTNYFRLA